MTRDSLRTVLVTAAVAAGGITATARQVIVSLTPERIAEAIQLGADPEQARRFLTAFVLQSHRASGDGPKFGEFSTPFSRVVRSSARAVQAKRAFAPADIAPQLLAPEVHVVAVSQETNDGKPASIQSITIWRDGAEIQPARKQDLNAAYREAFGVDVTGDGIVAIFPVDVFAQATQVIVHLDKIAKGASVISGCKDCVVPLTIRQLK